MGREVKGRKCTRCSGVYSKWTPRVSFRTDEKSIYCRADEDKLRESLLALRQSQKEEAKASLASYPARQTGKTQRKEKNACIRRKQRPERELRGRVMGATPNDECGQTERGHREVDRDESQGEPQVRKNNNNGGRGGINRKR